jgi:hypothetical protein
MDPGDEVSTAAAPNLLFKMVTGNDRPKMSLTQRKLTSNKEHAHACRSGRLELSLQFNDKSRTVIVL